MRGDESPCEANDLLPTVDAGDSPRGASLPHENTGQLSECVWIIIQGAINNYWELNPNSEVFAHGRVKMPHPEYYSGEPTSRKFEVFIVGIL